MRTAEDMINDLRDAGRDDKWILTVASATHGGRLYPEVGAILAGTQPLKPAKKKRYSPGCGGGGVVANVPLCQECGCGLVQGVCPELKNHITKKKRDL